MKADEELMQELEVMRSTVHYSAEWYRTEIDKLMRAIKRERSLLPDATSRADNLYGNPFCSEIKSQ